MALRDSVEKRMDELSGKRKASKVTRDGTITARIPKKLKRQIKVYCAMNDMEVQDFVLEALQAHLQAGKK